MNLYEFVGILAVIFPASFWAIKTFILSTVKTSVETVSDTVHEKLVEVQKDLQATKDNQLKFINDIDWMKRILQRMEDRLLDDKDE